MTPYEMMNRSGVMIQYKPYSRLRERIELHKAMEGLLPSDKTWHVALLAGALIIGFTVLFARWWLCV